MIGRFIGAAVLSVTLLTDLRAAQTVAEQLQKGIYAQETAGDLDAAIQIYRQILNSSAERKYAAVAQFRLAQSLLQKGELQDAAREFQTLANYPEYKDMIASLAGRGRDNRESVISRGTYTTVAGKGGRYVHNSSGVELTVPPGWTIRDFESSDNGDMAILRDSDLRSVTQVWMIAERHSASELPALLRHDLEHKSSGRPQGWTPRPQSIQTAGSGDHQYLSGIADYTIDGTKMIEYLTWARSPNSHVFFFKTIPASQESAAQLAKFTQIVSTAVIP